MTTGPSPVLPIRIRAVGTALPAHRFEQARLYEEALVGYFGANPKAAPIFANPAIQARHSVLPDPFAFFAKRPGAGERNAVYAEEAPKLARQAAEACLARAGVAAEDVDVVVTITCTGYMTPGVDIQLARDLGMRPDVRRYALGGMGCYAAFPGLACARQALQAGPARRALVVAVELCTLHFQDEADTDNVVSTSLFADGAAAALLEVGEGPGWAIEDMASATLYSTGRHMTWHLTDTGFRMHLSSYVPLILKEGVRPWLEGWLGGRGLGLADVPRWGLHPGGPRILDNLEEVLALPEGALAASREVLRECGNMSSATIFFVLDQLQAEPGERAGLLAFGPGLTMEGALLRRCEDT